MSEVKANAVGFALLLGIWATVAFSVLACFPGGASASGQCRTQCASDGMGGRYCTTTCDDGSRCTEQCSPDGMGGMYCTTTCS